jgi:ATPase subunit of ABC transporter with duplicated ATPase domains
VAITHDRYFLDNVAGWILELDRGAGIPFEGNYSSWIENKAKRMEGEKQVNASRERTIAAEYAFISQQRQGQQKRGKARLRKYEDLLEESAAYVRASTLDSIIIPIGPRLGDQVVEAKGLIKGYGDRLLIDGLNFELPPGAVVGVIGGNGAVRAHADTWLDCVWRDACCWRCCGVAGGGNACRAPGMPVLTWQHGDVCRCADVALALPRRAKLRCSA